MPKYEYKCKTCNEKFFIRHSIKEKVLKRPSCEKECNLERIPTLGRTASIKKKQKAGVLVRRHIEEAKDEILGEKEKAKKQEYEP